MMSESWANIGMEMARGCITTVFNLMIFLVPLMIIIETLMHFNIMEKLAGRLEGLAKLMGMSKNAMLPLLVGFFMGVGYGAGTFIEVNKRTPISKRDMVLVGIFMFLCHGIIETGMLFGVAGANVLVITVGRLLFALLITIVLSRTPFIRNIDSSVPSIQSKEAEEALRAFADKE